MTFDALTFLAGLTDSGDGTASQAVALNGTVSHDDAQPIQTELAALPLGFGAKDAADVAAIEASYGLREVWTPQPDDWQRRRLLYVAGVCIDPSQADELRRQAGYLANPTKVETQMTTDPMLEAINSACECIDDATELMAGEEPVADPGVWTERIKAIIETTNLAAEVRLRSERDLGLVLAVAPEPT